MVVGVMASPILRRSSPNNGDLQNPNPQIPTAPLRFRGIPFSWEQIPGIPKHQTLISSHKNKTRYSGAGDGHLLPLLPPPAGSSITKKTLRQEEKLAGSRVQTDPFLAALVACSNDDRRDPGGGGSNSKITRSLSDRLVFKNMSAAVSCKSNCAVAESVVYLPRHPTPHYLLHRRPR
ncbi:uncharacterized protein LOC127257292 [Andrographis paniculata]|uniref:uncharacterized protein LOC127257292 n=1 Tax=Andrographis paniculata TaxID=175694 RepID=UPI0021E93E56|nr:uncharacterized protein LOC127257292 [Andrographis paniculata]